MGDFEIVTPNPDSNNEILLNKITTSTELNAYAELTKEAASQKHILEQIHRTDPKDYTEILKIEPRIEEFYKQSTKSALSDSNNKLISRCGRGPYTFDEFYHLNRLMMSWFPSPPNLWILHYKSLWLPTNTGDRDYAPAIVDSLEYSPPPSQAETVTTIVDEPTYSNETLIPHVPVVIGGCRFRKKIELQQY